MYHGTYCSPDQLGLQFFKVRLEKSRKFIQNQGDFNFFVYLSMT